MTNDLVLKLESRSISQDNFDIIKKILYPNVEDSTLLMVIDYCKHRKLDIMKRPVQIVPVWDSKQRKMVDTIWQSITEIRITASRTGTYSGRDEAEFGEEVTEGKNFTYPKWCKVAVYRMVQGQNCKFSAKIFFKEAYKTAGKDTSEPNAMWKSRPYAQLEKCVEAAALRMAFPEELGSDYILEENWHEETKPEVPKDVTPKVEKKLGKEPRTEEQKLQDFRSKLQTIETLVDLDKFEIESKPYVDKLSKEIIQAMKEEIYNQRSTIEFNNISQLEGAENKEETASTERMK